MLNPKKRGPWRSSFNDPTGNPKPQIAPDRAARRAGEFEQTADRHVEAVDDGAYDFELFSRCATLAPLCRMVCAIGSRRVRAMLRCTEPYTTDLKVIVIVPAALCAAWRLPCRCACMAIFGMCTMHVILTWWPRVADLTSGLNATRSPSNAPPPSRLVHGARHGALFVQGRLVITSRRIDAAAGSCRRIDAPPPPVAPPHWRLDRYGCGELHDATAHRLRHARTYSERLRERERGDPARQVVTSAPCPSPAVP